MIEIGLCCDEGYAMPCGVCVTSIFESNKANKIRVHILTNGLTDDTVRRFEETAKKYGQIIDIHTIDDSLIAGLRAEGHFTIMVYARLLFPRVLNESVEKLLYLDCDIIVVGDLLELWATEFGDCACMATIDVDIHNNTLLLNKTKENNHTYVNSGVLLMNLPNWRENNWGEMCIEYARKYPEKCVYPDQDALNDIICQNIGYLHFRYNLQVKFFISFSLAELLHLENSMMIEARKNPLIIHYASEIKPWHREYMRRSKKYFLNALNCSSWSGCKFEYKKYHGVHLFFYYLRERLRDVRRMMSLSRKPLFK